MADIRVSENRVLNYTNSQLDNIHVYGSLLWQYVHVYWVAVIQDWSLNKHKLTIYL